MIDLNWYQYLNWHILEVKGSFVIKYLTRVRLVFEELEKLHISKIAIDLGHTTQFDSSAFTILINFNKRILSVGGRLLIIQPNKDIYDIFSMIEFEKVIPIISSKEELKKM